MGSPFVEEAEQVTAKAQALSEADRALLVGLPVDQQSLLIDRLLGSGPPASGASANGSLERSQTLPAVSPASSSAVQSSDFQNLEGDELLAALRENREGFKAAVRDAGPQRKLTTQQQLAARRKGNQK